MTDTARAGREAGEAERGEVDALEVTVVGAGIFGLWAALELAERGAAVSLCEAMPEADSGGASRFAGAMLAPYCEGEAAEPIVRELGLAGLDRWAERFPALVSRRGTIVVAAPRDQGELRRFARLTDGHRPVDAAALAALEGDLAGRFAGGLYFPDEAHLAPRAAIAALIGELRRLGVRMTFGRAIAEPVWRAAGAGGVVLDCRGMAARGDVTGLRGVRGEMAVVDAPDVHLSRPVRLLHPRFPLYVVPWGAGRYMIGATMIERDDAGPVTVRSALDLIGTAYAVDPAFAEARVLELSSCVRPAFADNVPAIVARGRRIAINGAFRHGYLLAPALARIVGELLIDGRRNPQVVKDGSDDPLGGLG